MRKPRPQLYGEVKPRPKTLKVICAACPKPKYYYITIIALPWEYKKALEQTKCMDCKVIGKLATSDLAKARPRPRTDLQIKLPFK